MTETVDCHDCQMTLIGQAEERDKLDRQNACDALLAACRQAARQLRQRLVVASPWGVALVEQIEMAIEQAEEANLCE